MAAPSYLYLATPAALMGLGTSRFLGTFTADWCSSTMLHAATSFCDARV